MHKKTGDLAFMHNTEVQGDAEYHHREVSVNALCVLVVVDKTCELRLS